MANKDVIGLEKLNFLFIVLVSQIGNIWSNT